MIDKRPQIIDNRKRLGDFEGDTVILTDNQRLYTLVDRKSGYTFIRYIQNGFAQTIYDEFIITDVDDDAIISIPEEYSLNQNYPNPFNPSTVISFNLPKQSIVSLKVFNILGEEVATLVNNKMINAGAHSANFNAANLPSGVYIYKISAGNYSASKKMMLLK